MGKKTTTPKEAPAANGGSPNIKDMSAQTRLLALRINDRRSSEEGKRLGAVVSEAKTDFKNTLKKAVPDDGEEAKARLLELQLLDEKIVSHKDKRAGFKQTIKDTKKALLYSAIEVGGQAVIPGLELELSPDALRSLRSGIAEVKAADKATEADDSDKPPRFPVENTEQLDALAGDLDAFIKSAGLSASSLGATPQVDTAAPGKGKSKGKPEATTAPVH